MGDNDIIFGNSQMHIIERSTIQDQIYIVTKQRERNSTTELLYMERALQKQLGILLHQEHMYRKSLRTMV